MKLKHRLTGLLCLALILSFSHGSRAQFSIEDFETQLDFTIRSACHGYMIDAIPDFFEDQREWLNRNTPFCQTVRTLPDSESSVTFFWQEKARVAEQDQATPAPTPEYRGKFESRMRAYYEQQQGLDIECQDWMCQHVRLEAWNKGNPISLADYNKVVDHCEGSYGCIEEWFQGWPRALPQNKVVLSLDTLLEADATSTAAAAGTQPAAPSTGLSLDDLLDGGSAAPEVATTLAPDTAPATTSTGLSLDNILTERNQYEVAQIQTKIDRISQRLKKTCDCSLQNSGCYELPSRDLLDTANGIEQQRYDQCTEWQTAKANKAETEEQANKQLRAFDAAQRRIRSLDGKVDSNIDDWHQKRKRLIAQQKREQQQREDAAYAAGMLSILSQSAAVASGSMTAEQAAQNAFNTTRRIENGGNRQTMKIEKVSSYVPNFSGGGDLGLTSSDSGSASSFSCYNSAQRICIDYQVNDANKARQMKAQCSQGANRIVSFCDKEGPSCTISNSAGTQTFFTYFSEPSTVRQSCAAQRGEFKQY